MKKLIILSIILLAASALQGRIIRIPADYATIQKGIDAAVTGDTVLVSPGTYVENIHYNGKNITVASLFLTTRDTSYISRTIIDGNKAGSVVTFFFGNKTKGVLSGFTITNGIGYNTGGGIYCYNYNPTIENVVITGNSAQQYWGGGGSGGGMYFKSSNPILKNVTVTNNTASEVGGGIFFDQCVPAFDSISRCNIYMNTASIGKDLYSNSPIKVIVDTFTVLDPQTYYAIPLVNFTFDILHGKVVQADADLYVSPEGDNSNSGLTPDGPLKTVRQALFLITADSLHPRTIHLLKGIYSPSANNEKFPIHLPDYVSLSGENSKTVIVDADSTGTVFRFNNNRTSRLSGITVTGASDRGVYCYKSSPVIENLIISGNNGGGILCENNSGPMVENVTISKNKAENGGGINCYYNSNPKLKNVTITSNTGTWQGGGIYCDGSFPAFDKNSRCNIYDNKAPEGNDLYSYSPITVVLDTFTVLKPQSYHAFPLVNFTFDILNGKVVQAEADVYVSPHGDGGNSGLTPDNPLKTLLQAYSILAADSLHPCTIHLLAGKYSPSATNEKFPVVLPPHVSLAGINATTVTIDAEGTGKVVHFEGNSTAHLSGMTITGGSDGGIYISNSSPFLENLIISGNSAPYNGGGIYCWNSMPTLENVTIANNKSSSQGGGMFLNESAPVFDSINRCNIYFNSAPDGSDLYSYSPVKVIVDTFSVLKPQEYHASPISNFTFDILHGKLVQAEGDVYISPDGDDSNSGIRPENPLKTISRALYVLAADSLNPCTIHLKEGKYSPSATNEKFPVIFPDYVSLAGIDKKTVIVDAEGTGRVFQFDGNATSRVSGMTITGGKSDSGGGIFCVNSSPIMENLIISGNSVHPGRGWDWYGGNGGGIYCSNSSPTIENVYITNNSAQDDVGIALGFGGGIYVSNSIPVLQNVTIAKNTASMKGGGIYCEWGGPVFDSISRCNIYHNTAPGGNDLYSGGPLKVIVDTFTVLKPQEYHASPISNITFDILHGKMVQAEGDVYVSPVGDNSHSGLSASEPFRTIRHAFAALVVDSLNPRTINLMDGTYGPLDNGEALPLAVPKHVSLKGSSYVYLNAGGAVNALRLENNYTSRISGITVSGATQAGIYLANSGAFLENIHVSNNTGAGIRFENSEGSVLHSVFITGNAGGGAISNSSHPRLEDVTISGNSVSGFSCNDSQIQLENVTITQNSGTGFTCSGDNTGALLQKVVISKNTGTYGGGMNLAGISPEFRNVVVTENIAMYGGGAYSSASFSGVRFSNNLAMYGGGLSILPDSYARPHIVNLVIDHNAAQYGGGIHVSNAGSSSSSRPYLKNLTCTENVAILGGGIYSGNGGGSVLYNTILWNNYPQEVCLENSYFSVHYSTVQGGMAGIDTTNGCTVRWDAGSMDSDPLFTGKFDNPYSLSGNSPCIDAGTATTGKALPTLDILGNNRFWDGNRDGMVVIDMGAYEFIAGATGVDEFYDQNSELNVRSYPNPFSSAATIEYQVEKSGVVSLTIFNNIGQPVAKLVNEFRPQGWQRIEWNAEGLPAGVYYFRLKAGDQAVTGRMLKL